MALAWVMHGGWLVVAAELASRPTQYISTSQHIQSRTNTTSVTYLSGVELTWRHLLWICYRRAVVFGGGGTATGKYCRGEEARKRKAGLVGSKCGVARR